MNRLPRLLLYCLPLVLAACSKKLTVTPTVGTPRPELAVEQMDFDYFQGKARMVLRDGNKVRDVKANIRIRKDSVIWMSFSVIGVQGGKALINHDSITIVNNVDNEYFVFEYDELSRRFNFDIDYDVVQAAMLGNLIMQRQSDDLVEQMSSMFVLKQQSGTVDVINYVNAASMKVEKVELRESDTNNSLTIDYSNFQPVSDKIFPYNGTINLLYKTPAGLINTTIIFEYNKAEIEERELKFPFNIPRKYVRR
ncbi:MAG TPA: DUF4292 domain-containing protein [Cyclobacteriaceae bacterium]